MAEQSEFLFNSTVDDELYDDLAELSGEKIVHVAVWEDSLVDAMAGPTPPDEIASFDMDLYLESGVYFELYSVAAYPDLESDPLSNRAELEKLLHTLVHDVVILGDVAVDEEDALVLVLAHKDKPVLYFAVGGFVVEEWDELPL